MARIRTIKPSFFTSADVCHCSAEARLLFIGLWCEADRAGRLHDRPAQLKIRLFPTDPWDIDALLWELAEAKLIKRMASEDTDYIQVVTFETHQRPHPKEPASLIAVNGRERSRQDTASRDQVVMLPVESRGKGREGKGTDLEGKGTGTGKPAPLVARRRLDAAFEGQRGLYVPQTLHRQFIELRNVPNAEPELLSFYADVCDEWSTGSRKAETPDSDMFTFWRARFKERWPPTTSRPVTDEDPQAFRRRQDMERALGVRRG